mgnify:CR=1 FL=1
MEMARPLGRFHPEAAPLSILFGHFLSCERKCRPRPARWTDIKKPIPSGMDFFHCIKAGAVAR